MKKQTEKQLEKKIILNLKMMGFYLYKTASSSNAYDYNICYNTAGMADLLVIGGPNRVTFLEVKTPTGRQSEKQKEFESLCLKHGVKYAVVRSVEEALEAVE